MLKTYINTFLKVIIVLILIIGCKKAPVVTVSTFKVNNGFGYLIKTNEKIIIKQETIPAIEESQPFCTPKDAKKTGNLVRDKILKKQNPALSLNELKQIEIAFNCKK